MPALFLMLLALVAFVLSREHAMLGVRFYLVPDVSKIDAGVVNSALSQAFFSLSLGMGIMITYGSYIDAATNLPASARLVAITDTAVAFAAGLLILPAIFSFDPGVDPASLSDSSIGLIFTFLPKVFLALQGSIGVFGASLVGTVFFVLVFFAAITSLVSIFEVPVAAVIDELGLLRRRALLSLGVLLLLLAAVCAASFGLVGALTDFIGYAGTSKSVFDLVYDIFYETILPLNGFLVCIFVSYRWKRANFNAELDRAAPRFQGRFLERYVDFALGTFIPLVLLLVFVNTVALKYFGVALIG
jgi:NSS family neurotransmitter:Na+ symporter